MSLPKSALGHSRPNWAVRLMSAFPLIASELQTSQHFRIETHAPQQQHLYSITHQRERAAWHFEVRAVEVQFAQ